MARVLSCGVIITDGAHILLGHATRSARWDIFKGVGEPGEAPAETASRELREETGLAVAPAELGPLGNFAYMPTKDLALFLWRPATMPEPATLICASTFTVGGLLLPEFDRFGLFSWGDALGLVGKNMARVLGTLKDALAESGSSHADDH